MEGKRAYVYLVSYVYIVSVLINFLWEMAQMGLYSGMSYSQPVDWLLCFRASLGDGVMVLVILLAGRLFFGRWSWFGTRPITRVWFTMGLGGIIGLATEMVSLEMGRWEYTEAMPVFTPFSVGLTPLLQMILLPPLVFWVVSRLRSDSFSVEP